jgi:hypothetical protein
MDWRQSRMECGMKPEDKAKVQQALEAMEYHTVQTRPLTRTQEAMDALRQLLEQQEPVFCEYCGGNDDADFGLPTDHCTDCDRPDPAPPADHGDELTIAYLDGVHTGKKMAKREWVGLTDGERRKLFDPLHDAPFEFAKRIEVKLREKNGGA